MSHLSSLLSPLPPLFSPLLSSITDCSASVGDSPQYIGDPLECALLEGLTSQSFTTDRLCGWTLDTASSNSAWSPPVEPERLLQVQAGSSSFSVHVLLSHPFDAAMQRMTVRAVVTRDFSDIANSSAFSSSESGVRGGAVTGRSGGQTPGTEYLIASKGSPESIFECLSVIQREDPGFRDSYFRAFQGLASQGKRVIAFASKTVPFLPQDCRKDNRRADAECNLLFQGFVSFECPLRSVFLFLIIL